jgi:hypothetical protein
VGEWELRAAFGEDLQYPPEKFDYIREHCTGHDTAKLIDNNFYTPCMGVMARMLDERPADDTYSRMINGAQDSFNPAQFKSRNGYYFPAIADNPREYIYPVSGQLKQWLLDYRARGKLTFIVTASHVDYALLVLNTCLEDDWSRYFDFLVCSALKPSFFTGDRPFKKWDSVKEDSWPHSGQLERGCVYLNGNARQLYSSIQALLARTDPVTCAYFGDSLSSDVVPSAQSGLFHPIAVVEEIQTEYVTPPATTASEEEEPTRKKGKCDAFSHYAWEEPWGSVFADHALPGASGVTVAGLHNTVLSDVIERNALLAIPTVEVLTHTSPDHRLNTFGNPDKKLGYFPCPPGNAVG